MVRTRSIAIVAALGMAGAFAGVGTALAGGGGHCAPSESRGDRVVLEGACFLPSTLYAEAGETITFVNRDSFAHNVSGTGWGHYEDMWRGARFSTSFAVDGIYPFACTLHPGMNGAIVVGNAPGSDAAVDELEPVVATAGTTDGGGGLIAAGLVGVVLGAVAGVSVASIRRRATTAPTS